MAQAQGRPLHALHVILSGLGTGGAERMLARVVAHASGRVRHTVLTLLHGDRLEADLRAVGVEYISFELDPRRMRLPHVDPRLLPLLRRRDIDVVVGWMNHGNVMASLLGPVLGVPVVLNFRNTPSAEELSKPIVRLLRRLSPRAERRLANSHDSIRVHEDAGFGPVTFVANGFSASEFHTTQETRGVVRRQHGIPSDAFVFGHVGRAGLVKNQTGIVRAIRSIIEKHDRVHLLAAGRGIPDHLAPHIADSPHKARIHLVPEVARPQDIYSASDAYVHNSDREGFPNVIAEAMLHELPIVCSAAGEASSMVEARNVMVPAGREDLLAQGMLRVLALTADERADLGRANRQRIRSLYSIETIAREYEAHLLEIGVG